MSSRIVLVINAGSSSLKFSVFRTDDTEILRLAGRDFTVAEVVSGAIRLAGT
ncbi:hypothetical protein [Nitrosomonas sp. HPC101]|uniref:hypothetical protein n=1 Tax=Nitrosomonas sp. HPC101 TaxID=1658667 RepID=UPI00136DA676|nr:hypothetical protein [Nitrosomonas sp. HPC101]